MLGRAALQTAEPIDWPQVAGLYRRLAGLTGSAVVELNRAAALAQAGDPAAALAAVNRLDLGGYLYYHSTPRPAATAPRPPRPGPGRPLPGTSWPPPPPERRFPTRRLEEI